MVKRKPKIKVCRNCGLIIENKEVQKCPNCGSTDFSDEYSGFTLIIDSNKSEIAKKTNLKEGKWAIKIF